MEEAAAEIDQAIALTAWEKALRDAYIVQHVYRIMFLVLDRPAFRERLLIDEHPRVEAWHQQLADLIATVMQARYETLTQRATQAHRRARRRARLAAPWRLMARVSRHGGDTAGPEGEGRVTK